MPADGAGDVLHARGGAKRAEKAPGGRSGQFFSTCGNMRKKEGGGKKKEKKEEKKKKKGGSADPARKPVPVPQRPGLRAHSRRPQDARSGVGIVPVLRPGILLQVPEKVARRPRLRGGGPGDRDRGGRGPGVDRSDV